METGTVIKENGPLVTVKLERKEACAKCKACTAGLETKDMFLEAENLCDAKIGDIVSVSLEQSNFIKAVAIMYVIPLIGLLIGIGLGYMVSDQLNWQGVELISVLFGFVLMAITFLTIRANEKRWNTKEFRPIADHKISN